MLLFDIRQTFINLIREAGGYSLVAYTQLVGVCLYVFVRSSLAARVREVMVDQVKTGLGGTTGNKGTVGISLSLGASSLCFLCSHFAAGQSQVAERNNDYSEAVKKISFSNVNMIFGIFSHFSSINSLRVAPRCLMTTSSGVVISITGSTWKGRRSSIW